MEKFGCDRCWPASAKDAWAARSFLAVETLLIDESHYTVTVRLCSLCGQKFLEVTTERIDWVAGEDPVCRTAMPITPSELAELTETGPPSESAINAIGIGRRSWKHDWAKDGPPLEYWSTGILVGPHH